MFGQERSRMKSTERYADGSWHQIRFERKANATQIMVDGSIVGQETVYRDSQTFPTNIPFYIGGLHASLLVLLLDCLNRTLISFLMEDGSCRKVAIIKKSVIVKQNFIGAVKLNVQRRASCIR